jgi:hypothetical protein
MVVERFGIAVALILACCTIQAQTPRPFPQPAKPTIAPGPKVSPTADVPTEAMLGAPIYPNAQYITSYDAGKGQRFYLFGAGVPFPEMVAYYRKVLKQNGSELFLTPPTHQFEIGRFREETMAFPPSVTIKDYLWGGTGGYLNPNPAAQPRRFPTIIQIVAAPAATR